MNALLILKKAGITFLVIVLLALSMSVSASSAIDMNAHGSLTINKSNVDTSTEDSLSGIKFTVYKVAELSNSGDYNLTNDFSASGVQLDKLSTASAVSAASKDLVSYISAKSISGISNVTNVSGTVKFNSLALGYYLVVQSDDSENQNIHSTCSPFLVAVPMKNSDGSNWLYDIVANSKSEAECGAVILKKVDDSGTLLSGAVFRLEKKIYYTDSSSMPTGVKTGTDSSGEYYWSILVSELTTNKNGQVAVKSMPFGQYRFIEIIAPTGYTLDSTPHEFTISDFGTVTLADGIYVTASGTVQTITVLNSDKTVDPIQITDDAVPQAGAFDLPKTGGSICYAVCTYGGIILMLFGAAVFLASRKKKVL
jgi:uncharacterized surface anchored protein